MKNKKEINLFEAFSGIGSQHLALKNIGYKINLIGISDWYIDAIIAYCVNHLGIKTQKINKKEIINYLKNFSLSLNSKDKAKNLNNLSEEKLSILYQAVKKFGNLDIKFIHGENFIGKNIDLFTYSFPCQDISQQGKQKGFSKETKTRSGLLWEIERILEEIHNKDKKSLPKILMMENVKALLSKNFKEDLEKWIKKLESFGYKSTVTFSINSKDLGEAQNRERVFMFSYLGKKPPKKFEIKNIFKEKFIKDIFEEKEKREIFKTDKNFKIIEKEKFKGIKKAFLEGYSKFNSENYVYYLDGKAPTITSSGAHSRIKIFYNGEIVYLNGLEHLKLQGFDKYFYKNLVKYGITETKIKFLAGNSINVKVLEELFKFYL